VTVLALDASTARATVAVLRSGAVVAATDVAERSEHVEPLLPAALALLASASIALTDLSAILCGAGPGSFTGLRTAASIAKGLAMGLSVPLHAVPSLPLILAGLPPGRYVATLDAGRGDVFAALIEWPRAEGAGYILVPATKLAAIAAESGAQVVGPETGHWPHIKGAARLEWGPPVDLATWEPDYGRDSAAEDRRRAGSAR
jgi:tRNA threonylcarbamoyladenosine biosynthesis protein TsaB